MRTEYQTREVYSTPLHADNLQQLDPEILYGGLEQNLHLVIGGEVTLPDGTKLFTNGFLNQAYQKIQQEINDLNFNEQETKQRLQSVGNLAKGRLKIFGWTLIRSEMERDAEKRYKNVVKSREEEENPIKTGIEIKQLEIQRFLHQKNIDPAVQENFDHMIKIEEYLAKNSQATEFNVLAEHAAGLGLSTDNLREDFNKLMQFSQKLRPDYMQYRNLVLGEDVDNEHVWGLRDYQQELQRIEDQYSSELTETKTYYEQVTEEVNGLVKAQQELKQQKQRLKSLYETLDKIGQIRDYLSASFLPSKDEVIETRNNLVEDQEKLRKLESIDVEYLQLQDQILGERGNSAKQAEEARGLLRRKLYGLSDRMEFLVNPLRRLKDIKAPNEICKAMEEVSRPTRRHASYSWDKIYEQGYQQEYGIDEITEEATKILIGKSGSSFVNGIVDYKVEPEVTDPEVINRLPVDVIKENARNLTVEDINNLPLKKVGELVSEGLLSPIQLSHLPKDQLISTLNETIIHEAGRGSLQESMKNTQKVLIKSVKTAERGRKGIPVDLLPKITAQAAAEAFSLIAQWSYELSHQATTFNTPLDKMFWSLAHNPLTIEKAIEELRALSRFNLGLPGNINKALKMLTIAQTGKFIYQSKKEELKVLAQVA